MIRLHQATVVFTEWVAVRRDTSISSSASSSLLPLVLGLAVMVVWGGTPLFSKVAASEVDPVLVGILRTVLAGCLALPIALSRKLELPKDSRGRQLLAFSGFAAFIAFPLMFTVGQHMTTALHGALILATLPVFTSFFGKLVERTRLSKTWLLGCAIALVSESVVIVWKAGAGPGRSSVIGDLIVLGSAVVCSMGYVAGARLSQRGHPAASTTLWGTSFAALALLPVLAWSLSATGLPHAGAPAWASIVVLAVATSVLGYVVWYWALARGGISRVASVQFTQPLFGVALAWLVLGERPAPVIALAAAGILFGAWLVHRSAA